MTRGVIHVVEYERVRRLLGVLERLVADDSSAPDDARVFWYRPLQGARGETVRDAGGNPLLAVEIRYDGQAHRGAVEHYWQLLSAHNLSTTELVEAGREHNRRQPGETARGHERAQPAGDTGPIIGSVHVADNADTNERLNRLMELVVDDVSAPEDAQLFWLRPCENARGEQLHTHDGDPILTVEIRYDGQSHRRDVARLWDSLIERSLSSQELQAVREADARRQPRETFTETRRRYEEVSNTVQNRRSRAARARETGRWRADRPPVANNPHDMTDEEWDITLQGLIGQSCDQVRVTVAFDSVSGSGDPCTAGAAAGGGEPYRIRWDDPDTWRTETGAWPVVRLDDRFLWETLIWLVRNREHLADAYAAVPADCPPALAAAVWLRDRPLFRSLLREGVRRHLTFPDDVYAYFRDYVLDRRGTLDGYRPWRDDGRGHQAAELEPLLHGPLVPGYDKEPRRIELEEI